MKRILCMFLAVLTVAALFPCYSASAEENPFASYDSFREEYINTSIGSSTCIFSTPSYAPENADKKYIVTFKEHTAFSEIHNCVKNYSYRLLANSNERVFSINIGSLSDFRDKYSTIVADIAEDNRLSLSATVNDPMADAQWELDFLDIYEAWDIPDNGKDITVAVLDSGIFREHQDFSNVNILNGYDAVTHSVGINFDANGHGTQICSIIAAERNNKLGMCGIADKISILPIRVSDESGYVHSSDFIEAVYYAADAGVNVINMSFGGYIYSAQEEAAMRYAAEKGCISVSAAGNEATSPDYAGMKSYPASYADVISVGACDTDGAVCSFSQHNDAVDMLAPGYLVTVANAEGGYEAASGTSYATAYVSGVIALALSTIDVEYTFTADQFTSHLAHIRQSEHDDQYGYGAINAVSILETINTPMVSGIMNGGVYLGNIAVSFNRGIATLDEKPFISGDSVIVSGNHILSIVENEQTYTFEFITDNIPLQYYYEQNSDNAVFTFTRGSATVDGLPYVSGTPITDQGKHLFEITGPYGNTEIYEFTCEFEAPVITGVEDGEIYNGAVSISVPKGGIVTLDGNIVGNCFSVADSGKHTVVSYTADSEKSRSVSFYIDNEDCTVYKATIANANIIADEENGVILMYNDFLSGTRVLTTMNPNSTRNFIRTEYGIKSHSITSNSIILLHENGISLLNRKAVSAGNDASAVYIPFNFTSVDSFVLKDNAYYIAKKGSTLELRCLNVVSKQEVSVSAVDPSIVSVVGDEEYIVACSTEKIYIYDKNGNLVNEHVSSRKINNIICGDGYVCTDSVLYKTKDATKLFALFSDEKPIKIYNGLLITNKSVYDISSGTRLAFFSVPLQHIDIDKNGNVYKSLPEMKFEKINADGERLNRENCVRLLNACADNTPLLLEAITSSIYVNHAAILTVGNITDMGIDAQTSVVYAVSRQEHMFYIIDGNTMTVTESKKLRYAPDAICFDGKNYHISFADDKTIYTCSANGKASSYSPVSHSYVKLMAKDGYIYGLTNDGSLYMMDTTNLSSAATPIIVSQNIVSFDVEDRYVYAYLKPASVSMVYKINLDTKQTEAKVNVKSSNGRIFVDGDKIFIGKAVLNILDLSTIYRLQSDISYADRNYVLNDTGLYSAADGTLITKCTVPTDAPVFDSTYNYYNFSDTLFTKIENVRGDLHSAPIIHGIVDGQMYEDSVSISYEYGTAYINGVIVPSGTTISDGGRHTLTLALPFGVKTTVTFTINANIAGIDIYAEKTSIRVNETIGLTVISVPSSYGAVDVMFTTDNSNVTVNDDGTIIGVATGECTVTATTLDGLHSDSVKIRITKTEIELKSSYFDMLEDGKTIRVSAGTSLGILNEAIKEIPGNSGVFSANGVRIEGGILTTGMSVRLYDLYENIIDERVLSVLGDVDCDGYITANDYALIQQLSSTQNDISYAVFNSADTDDNGIINSFDILNIKEHLLNVNIIDIDSPSPDRQAKATITMTAPPSVNPSARFTVGLLLNESANISAADGKITYDPTQLSFEGAEVVGGGWNGDYEVTSGQLSFFSYGRAGGNSKVLLLASFTVMPSVDISSGIIISIRDMTVFDGSAATVNGSDNLITLTEQSVPYIILHNSPDFVFDPLVSEYNVHFQPETDRIFVSVSPSDIGVIAGTPSFGNGLSTHFSVVLHSGSNELEQFDFYCTKDEVSETQSPPNVSIKNDDCSLAEITVNNGQLTPTFSPDVYEYFLITDGIPSVNAIANNDRATVAVSDSSTNTSRITVTCTSESGKEQVYVLNIRRGNPAGNDFIPDKSFDFRPYIFAAIFAALLVVVGIFIRCKTKKQKQGK